MPLGTTAALLMAGGAFSATSSIMAGNQQAAATKKQAEYTAQVYDQQAEMVKQQKAIADQQFLRNSNIARGKIVAASSGKGMNLSASPLAVLIDNESQMQFDAAIGDYNSQVQQNYYGSAATNTRWAGQNNARVQAYTGYTNAFSTMLNTGASMNYVQPGLFKI